MAVVNNEQNIRYVYDRLKNDKDVVLTAIKQNGLALKYASESIKSLCKDKDPVEVLEKAMKAENLSDNLEKALSKSQQSQKPRLKI